MLTRDNRAQEFHIEQIPDWVEKIVRPKWTSGFDYAYSVKPSFNIAGTQIYGSVKMVGPGYQTLGNPTLRKDNLVYGGGIKRSFLKNRISFSGSYNTEHDNLINMKRYTTTFTSYSANLGLKFPNAPYFQINYKPYTQQNENIKVQAQTLSINSGYSFAFGSVNYSPNLAFSFQKRQTLSPSDDYTMFDVNLSHSFGFKFPLSVSISSGLNQSTYPTETSQTVSVIVSPSYTMFGSWNNSLTIGGSFQDNNKRYDTRLNSSFPVWKICNGNVGVERNFYRGDDGKYNEFRLTSSLNRSW
jgi:hypothetical protein